MRKDKAWVKTHPRVSKSSSNIFNVENFFAVFADVLVRKDTVHSLCRMLQGAVLETFKKVLEAFLEKQGCLDFEERRNFFRKHFKM